LEVRLRAYPQSADVGPYTDIDYAVDDGVCRITITRERTLNSLCLNAFREIRAAVNAAGANDSVGVIVITGAGEKAFCSGADVAEHLELCQRPRDYVTWVREFVDMQTTIVRAPVPTIARLNGIVLAAGNELNLACDLAVAADHVTIQQAGPARGSIPGIGVTQWLPLAVGDRRAREVVFLCEPVPATTALDWGLVNQVVPAPELDDAVRALADKLLAKFPESLRYAKVALNQGKEEAWASVPHVGEWLALHAGSVEAHEGMTAFRQKRPVRHDELRRRAAADTSPEFWWGPPTRDCPNCAAAALPANHRFCGNCGEAIDPAGGGHAAG
jgi:enoyl-CoA hydratase/carnithine racemase